MIWNISVRPGKEKKEDECNTRKEENSTLLVNKSFRESVTKTET